MYQLSVVEWLIWISFTSSKTIAPLVESRCRSKNIKFCKLMLIIALLTLIINELFEFDIIVSVMCFCYINDYFSFSHIHVNNWSILLCFFESTGLVKLNKRQNMTGKICVRLVCHVQWQDCEAFWSEISH